jgi:nitrogen fixation-related uncharacterized protein
METLLWILIPLAISAGALAQGKFDYEKKQNRKIIN